ncbi:cysteine protease, putative [Medicago truncatula]|uniref:Cysteine protease, putative n=1 Tax=Medicago truncatula TaxID=3880 RepID=G7K827_MEDTR|nr:cysteine protease, putative [Medicago truncatula]
MTNMIIFKSPEYSCLRICNVDDAKVIVIDRICICSKLIFQLESNKHRTKTENQTHLTKKENQNKQSRSETTKSQKQTKENRKYVKSLIQL